MIGTGPRAFFLAAMAALSLPVFAADVAVRVEQPWSRPTPPGVAMGVGYMTLINTSDRAVTLVAAETPRAARVSIHESTMNDGLMAMRPLSNGLTIPAGGRVVLQPHGYHLMLEKLAGPLKAGQKIPMALSFDGAATLSVELHVRPLDSD